MSAPKGHPAYNVNGEGGRPLKYTAEFIENEAEEFEKWIKKPESVYFKEFALERGYSPQRLNEFAETNQRFAETFNKVKQWQETKLVKGGLINEFNASFTKFVMANAFGWYEKQETRVSGDSGNPLAFIFSQIDGTTKDLVNDE